MPSGKKCRIYKNEYLTFGFIAREIDGKTPLCLLCHKVFSNEAIKPSRLQVHLKRIHLEKHDKRVEFFEFPKNKFRKQESLLSFFAQKDEINELGSHATYEIANLIAKTGSTHTLENIIVPAFNILLKSIKSKFS
ncbi:Protein FAM200B [Dictyocoela muelleri]|nr:Protein FAM200B [Dictyocoela muelleri]